MSEIKSWPKVSIVTPSYNQDKFIEEAIVSVLSQNYPNLEYIVIDGGSTDNSIAIIKAYEKHLTYWVSEPDKGQGHALNKGFACATGEIFGWLNSDDFYAEETFKNIVTNDWKDNDFLYGKGCWVQKNGKSIGLYPTFKPNRYTLRFKCTLCQPTVFFKRDAFLELGKLSEEYYCVLDYEYWLRAVMKAKKFGYINSVLAYSRMYLGNKTLSSTEKGSFERNMLINKYYSNIDLNILGKYATRYIVNGITALKRRPLKSLSLM